MPRPLNDDFNPEDLDGNDFAESWDNREIFGPIKAQGDYLDILVKQVEADLVAEEQSIRRQTPRLEVLRLSKFKCANCRVDCSAFPRLLEVHHPDRDQTAEDPRHLMALCITCHSNMPGEGHALMKVDRNTEWFRKLDELRAEQGIPNIR